MSIFEAPPASSGRRRSRVVGGWLLTVGVVGFLVFALIPAPYVIDVPGPVFNTLGKAGTGDSRKPLISVPNETTYPTGGALDLLTVSTVGDPDSPATWWEIVQAWFDPSRKVTPMDEAFPPGLSISDLNEQGRLMMANSQQAAVAAALIELGYTVPSEVTVGALLDNSPAVGKLEPGDVIVSVAGQTITGVDQLRQVIGASGVGNQLSIVIKRNGETKDVSVVPILSDDDPPAPIVGFYPSIQFDFPIEVDIQLENVGGPSGGQMFALGIIDLLTPGELNGGEKVAGTGTIEADGTIGAIGGIQQKLFGALWAKAKWFLAPKSNCDEVVGHVPDGLTVVAVSTLKDSLAALKAIETGVGVDSLPSCSAG
ncbi:MAG: PDZ domain-containing protein [Cryobacterium sp.]|nr:PDZ domain-containing protein [Cryobacterium sp.]MBX3090237.1 PDZ domain-containing protein [Cryobacterium sp.]MCO5293583.1 PDZ domain-containing protein [Homoserinimonas sp.]